MISSKKKSILLIFLIIIVTLFIIEGLLRIFQINKSWSEQVGHGYSSGFNWKRDSWLYTMPADSVFEVNHGEFKYTYTTNSLGIREKEFVFADSSANRIICIGDSYTEGLGAPYDSSYPRILEYELNMNGYCNETYNAGVAGSDPFFGFMLLKMKLIHLEPQCVLMTFNSSDLTDYIFRGGMERFKRDSTTQYLSGPWFEKYYAKSYLVRFIISNILSYENNVFIKRKRISAKYADATGAYALLFDTVNVFLKKRGIGLFVIIQPIADELAYKNRRGEIINCFNMMEQELTQRNILSINMHKVMTGMITPENQKYFCYIKDAHFNSSGYHMFAENLLIAINQKYPFFFRIDKNVNCKPQASAIYGE